MLYGFFVSSCYALTIKAASQPTGEAKVEGTEIDPSPISFTVLLAIWKNYNTYTSYSCYLHMLHYYWAVHSFSNSYL